MNKQELLIQIKALPLKDQMELMEALRRNLRGEIEPRPPVPVEKIRGIAKPKSPASELRGILKTDDPPPTDEETKEAYINYLSEKYS